LLGGEIAMIHNTRAGQQFRQLPMFMTAREIRSDYQALDGDRRESKIRYGKERDDEVFSRKYNEASEEPRTWDRYKSRWLSGGPSLTEQIQSEGVRNPVSLQVDLNKTGSRGKPEILGGHHRVAVMEAHKPDTLMPVEHFDNSWNAGVSLGKKY
jgi:hypothetical protein